MTITNSTFSGNEASCTGGVIAFFDGSVTLRATILAASTNGNCRFFIHAFDAGYNIPDDNSCLFSNTGSLNNTNPDLSGLASNGGPTQTIALLPGSPAIEAIPLAECIYYGVESVHKSPLDNFVRPTHLRPARLWPTSPRSDGVRYRSIRVGRDCAHPNANFNSDFDSEPYLNFDSDPYANSDPHADPDGHEHADSDTGAPRDHD